MLQSLYVKNLALIEEVELDLRAGLNVLSGETGAGKSIIIDSISFALGEKVDKSLLRDKDKPGMVQLTFGDISDSLREYLRSIDIDVDSEVILTRKITDTKTVAKINDESVTATRLKEVASRLIDIHGQSEHQSLLKKSFHLSFLDSFLGPQILPLLDELKASYSSYRDALRELEESGGDEKTRLRELDILKYEVGEIEDANLKSGEDEELEIKFKKMSNASKILESLSEAESAAGDRGASEMLSVALMKLSAVSSMDDELSGLEESLRQADDILSGFRRDLRDYISGLEFDEADLKFTSDRLDKINTLKNKYGRTIEDIFSSLSEKKERVEFLENFAENEKKLKEKCENLLLRLNDLSERLSQIRKNGAVLLAEKITTACQELNFLQTRFEIEFSETGVSALGKDSVEYLISLNPGQPLKPLRDVASGGELSRIMLALKSVLAENDEIPTLIFDEIDTGISGRTAQMVSEKLSDIAKNHQVICITHLPQIASMADWHYFIEKEVVDNNTTTGVRVLGDDERIEELGRMLSGVEITDTVRQSAREMLLMAAQKKQE